MRKNINKYLGLLIVMMGVIPSLALAAPGIPHQFYGNVTFDSGTTPDGLTVETKVDGVVVGTSQTKDGKYGYNPSLFFAVNANGDWAGETANFFVSGTDTGETFALAKGGYKNLNLTVPGSIGTLNQSATDVITNQSVSITPTLPTVVQMGDSATITISSDSDSNVTSNIEKVEKLSSSFFSGSTAVISGKNVLNAFEIKISGTGLSIAVTMNYDDTGIDESTVKPYKFDGTNWVAITPYTQNTTANTISYTISAAATPYAIFGSSIAVVSSGGGGGSPYTPLKGDMNGDNTVDKYDFALLMANWGKIGSNVSDLNNDSKVDKYDFALLMSNWSI